MAKSTMPGQRTLAAQVMIWFALIYLGIIAVAGFLIDRSVTDALIDRLASELETGALLVTDDIGTGPVDPDVISQLAGSSSARITVMTPNGVVVADSLELPENMENHADRPEVVAALAGEVGLDRRTSATLGDSRLYVAVPPQDGFVVRFSIDEAQIDAEISGVRRRLLLLAVLFGVLGTAMLAWGVRRVTRPLEELTAQADEIAKGALGLRPRRSPIKEVDGLGLTVVAMADELHGQLHDAETERRTLEAVLGRLQQGVVLFDSDDTVIYSNEVMAELVGSPVPERLQSITPNSIQAMVRQARLSDEAVVRELEGGVPLKLLRTVVRQFSDGDGRVLLVADDITARNRTEAMRKAFVADASHELKTPIASVLASSEALKLALERDPSRAGQFADSVELSARRLARIVEDLLDLSRLEVAAVDAEVFQLDALVAEEVAGFGDEPQEQGVGMTTSLEECQVFGSASDIGLAVRNLCENALRYTDAGGEVHLKLVVEADECVLSVTDTGVGIPSRSLPRVFERFYRVDVARSRNTGGTGLGLALVKHAVERNGGHIAVESELGVGTKFTVTLPLAQ